MALSITYGEGLQRPQGKRVSLPEGQPIDTLIAALRTLPRKHEAWWSPSTWRGDYRLAKAWESSSGVAVDIDYDIKDASPPVNLVETLVDAARAYRLPGSAFHLTPHGCRLFFGFAENCTDPELYVRASFGAGALAAQALADCGIFDYRVDEAILKDLGRLFFAPCAFAKGVQRDAEVIDLQASPYVPAELADFAPPPVEQPRAQRPASVSDLISRWNTEHPGDWPRAGGDCPMCGHRGCFGRLPDDESRWYCFSTDHSAPGIQGASGYHGDALDLEAYTRGCKPIDVLRADGYLSASAPTPAADITPIDSVRRAWHSNSYLTCVALVEGNERDILGPGAILEYDEMADRVTINRRSIADEDETRVRAEIERRFSGGIDKNGNQRGMKMALQDVRAALRQVGKARPYHPIREYLMMLRWDGVGRLAHVPDDILSAERSALNQALVRRFFVSAVARAMKPGCKVDTVLILVGKQGCGKSSFFRLLAGEWFVDTAINLEKKDSFMVLRCSWLYEWAELEAMRRAKDVAAVKAFLTSQRDTYVPPYGHNPVDVPRSCVIVGSTNEDEFLTDSTGNRRFWPVRVGDVDLELLGQQRDQLWAEALNLYRNGESWWLTPEEGYLLDNVHEEHVVVDAWDEMIWSWARHRMVDFSAGDVLSDVIGKPKGQWDDRDLKRVARCLRRGGWRPNPKKKKGLSRTWLSPSTGSGSEASDDGDL